MELYRRNALPVVIIPLQGESTHSLTILKMKGHALVIPDSETMEWIYNAERVPIDAAHVMTMKNASRVLLQGSI